MSQPALAEDVRYERVSTPRALEAGLRALPEGVRFGITRELNDRGQVFRLDGQSQRVHYLRWDGDDIVIVTWGPMSTLFEAAILLSSIKTLARPIDEKTAVQLCRQATFRAEFVVEPRKHPQATASKRWSVELFSRSQRTLRGVSVMLRNAPGLVERLLRGRARLPASAPSAAYEQVAATPLKAG